MCRKSKLKEFVVDFRLLMKTSETLNTKLAKATLAYHNVIDEKFGIIPTNGVLAFFFFKQKKPK